MDTDWKKDLIDKSAIDRAKVKIGDIYRRLNNDFEIVYVAFAWVVLHSTSLNKYGIRIASPFVETIQYLLDANIKYPYVKKSD